MTLLVDSIACQGADNARSQLPIHACCRWRALCSLGVIMRPNALRIIFGLLLGALAAFFIGALPLIGPPKARVQSSAFALRFSPAPPGLTR
jgi:hypothetical protein